MGSSILQKHIIGLDIIRFMAAALVMIFHLAYWQWAPDISISTSKSITFGNFKFPELITWSWFGWIGVEIFFVISGFVISFSATRSSYIRFIKDRSIRLYPSAWICGSISAIVLLIIGVHSNEDLLRRYISTLALYPLGPWVDGVYWTLGVEIIFYLFILIAIIFRVNYAVPIILFLIGFFSAVTVILSANGINILPNQLPYIIKQFVIYACFFSVGGFIYLSISSKSHFINYAIIAIVFFLVTLIAISNNIDSALNKSPSYIEYLFKYTPLILYILSIALIIISVKFNAYIHNYIGKYVVFVRTLGLMTYPLYLIHDVFGSGVLRLSWELGFDRWVGLSAAVTSSVVLAYAVTRYLEPPLKVVLRRVLDYLLA